MYRRAQIWLRYSLCLALASLPLGAAESITTAATKMTDVCPTQCICLSKTQIMCNNGGFVEIPRLSSQVEELSLSNNNFGSIRKNAFGHLRQLRKLELNENNITSIKAFAFSNLRGLQILSIQRTPLSYIGEFSFAALQNVSSLVLTYNKITYIEGKAFAGSSQITYLMLNYNPLKTIKSNAFSGLTDVKHLVLPTGVQNVEPDAFNGLEDVFSLKMNYLDLKDGLKPYTFRGLKNVNSLLIDQSDLGVIRKDAFSGLEHMDALNLVSNKIDAIEELHLKANYSVVLLRFIRNHVLRAPRPRDISLQVTNLIVEDNHFPCDCQIHLVLESDFVNGSTDEFRAKNYCISAAELNGRLMSLIELDSIASCHDKLTKDNYGSGVSIDSSAVCFLVLAFVYLSRLVLA